MWRPILCDAAKNAGTVILGSTLGGSVIALLNGFGLFVHGSTRPFTIEATLGGAFFGLLGGTVFLAPFAAMIGGLLSRFVGRKAATIAAIAMGIVVFSLSVLAAIVVYSRVLDRAP